MQESEVFVRRGAHEGIVQVLPQIFLLWWLHRLSTLVQGLSRVTVASDSSYANVVADKRGKGPLQECPQRGT